MSMGAMIATLLASGSVTVFYAVISNLRDGAVRAERAASNHVDGPQDARTPQDATPEEWGA